MSSTKPSALGCSQSERQWGKRGESGDNIARFHGKNRTLGVGQHSVATLSRNYSVQVFVSQEDVLAVPVFICTSVEKGMQNSWGWREGGHRHMCGVCSVPSWCESVLKRLFLRAGSLYFLFGVFSSLLGLGFLVFCFVFFFSFRLHTNFVSNSVLVKNQTKEFAVGVTAVIINNGVLVWKVSTG